MSSCASSTLPPPHLSYGYSNHHVLIPSDSSYRSKNISLRYANRLSPTYHIPTPTSNNTTPSGDSVSNTSHTDVDALYTSNSKLRSAAMPISTTAASTITVKKRQREREPREPREHREPDWHTFYKNGLPKEVIVIDDSPTPDPPTFAMSKNQSSRSVVDGENRHASKRRKRGETGSRYENIYAAPHASSYKDSTGSTASTDRTKSSARVNAAASYSSLSSNGQTNYAVSDSRPNEKILRCATRLQVAKKLEADTDAFITYKPPPKPLIKAPEVLVKQVPDNSFPSDGQVDDEDGHYIVVPEADLTERYQVTKLLGQGTFGKVVQARDRRRNKQVAIKIIRSVQKYRDASRIELRVLSTLKANDNENRNRCIHLRDCFDYRGHICIVMDLLGQSVFDFLKSNSFVPFPNSQIQSFARQLFTSVAFLHDLNLIHTDLKPENILLCDNSYQAFTYSRRIPSSSTSVSRQAAQRKVLMNTEIRLIDFGSATFQDEYHSSVVSTRHYRAPEIILGLGWSFPCDIWSIGCILVEFFTGDALFQTHDNLEHLAMMENVCAARIDVNLIHQVNSMSRKNGGNPAAKYFKRLKLDYPQPDTTRASRRFVKAMKRLDEIIPDNLSFLRNFMDLLKKIFVYDPDKRITAKEALQHPWFKEPSIPDDGTEANRIRLQKQQAAMAISSSSLATSRHVVNNR